MGGGPALGQSGWANFGNCPIVRLVGEEEGAGRGQGAAVAVLGSLVASFFRRQTIAERSWCPPPRVFPPPCPSRAVLKGSGNAFETAPVVGLA